MHDPFAVSQYDLGALPAVRDRERHRSFFTRGAGGRPGFGDIWMAHAAKRKDLLQIGPVDYLVRLVMGAFEADRWGFLDVARAGVPGQRVIEGTPENTARAMVVPNASLRDQQSRRLALVTLIDHLALCGQRPTKDLRKAVVLALDLESRVAKRIEASTAAAIEGKQLAEGATDTAAVAAVRAELGISHGKAWALRRSPLYRARRDEARAYWSAPSRPFIVLTKQHAPDIWFAGGTLDDRMTNADGVAQVIIDHMRLAKPRSRDRKRALLAPVEMRWDVLNLLEGYHRLKQPPSEVALVALDYALGLIGPSGKPNPVPLAGVTDRALFMAAALVEARRAPGDPHLSEDALLSTDEVLQAAHDATTDVGTLREWRRMPLYQTAVEELRKAR